MVDEKAPAQHLTPDSVEDYFRAGVPTAFTMSADVQAQLEIDPQHHELRLLCPALGADPDVTSYERISVERVSIVGHAGEWFRLTVDARGMHYEGYVLIESIVDQLRGGASFRHSVSESLSGLKDLLSSRRKFTEEKEAGLIGELLVLEHVLRTEGEDSAVTAWLGPLSEEHDFGFAAFDAEVKTTRSEGRSHQIGSETQLAPVPGRPLYLVSVQITKAGEAVEGFTLPQLIARTRALLTQNRRLFESALGRLGWRDDDEDLYQLRHMVRATPRAYLVDDLFPAITPARLASVPQRTLVSGIAYRVDVSALEHSAAPATLADFCEGPN